MKILLVNPPNSGRSIPEERYGIDTYRKIFRGEPLALEVLAGNLPDHDLRIVDLKVEADGLAAAVEAFTPDLVGVTGMTCEANAMLRIAAEVKQRSEAVVVVGGVHASAQPEFFNRPPVDYVVVGVGRASFAELVRRLEAGEQRVADLAGVACTDPAAPLRWQARSYSTADITDGVAPRYDLVRAYREAGHYVMTPLPHDIGFVVSSYGCPYACSFCCISSLTGGRFLPHSVDAVLRDIATLDELQLIRLIDANAFGDVARARQLAERLLAEGVHKHFIADIRSDTVVRHPDLIASWKQAGLRAVVIGFEEIDDSGLATLDKRSTVATNSEAIRILHDLGVTIVGDFIVSPDADEASFDALGAYLEDTEIDLPMLAVLTPLPGTGLHRRMADRIVVHDLDYYTLTNAVIETRLPEETFYRRYAELINLTHADASL
jgi:radical SAM superfamily enzyme YgiQ (UPF0313 family)